jgi:hypothetical protein
VFDSGDRMDAPRAISLDKNVDPGEMVDVKVELVAPDDEGRYRGDWQLETASGNRFGIGSGADGTFYVLIEVVKPPLYAYDFGANYCAARWSSNAGRLGCPGRSGDDNGFVQLLDRPVVEIDRQENEKVLWTNPFNGVAWMTRPGAMSSSGSALASPVTTRSSFCGRRTSSTTTRSPAWMST